MSDVSLLLLQSLSQKLKSLQEIDLDEMKLGDAEVSRRLNAVEDKEAITE